MNSWLMNSVAQYHFKNSICKSLDIPISNVYKTIKNIRPDSTIETKDGKKYKLILEEV